MAVAAFILGGIVGLIGVIATLMLTDAGWGMSLMVYFGLGYAVPGVALGALLLRAGIRSRSDAEGSRHARKARVSRP